MGCDIHAHIEVKVSGEWHHWMALNIPRNYSLFARLAGVRTDKPGDQQYPLRGIPDNMSLLTNMDYNRGFGDWHHLSWITGKELSDVQDWYEREARIRDPEADLCYVFSVFGYLFGNGYDVKRYPEDYPSTVEDVRMVFWFDN